MTAQQPLRGGAGLGLGITALVLGILMFWISWVPPLGLVALSGLGLVFGLVGLIIGIVAMRESAIAFSAGGVAVSFCALVVALVAYWLS